MKKALTMVAALAAFGAFGITATKEYVDLKDAAITNAVHALGTNTYTKAQTDARIAELIPAGMTTNDVCAIVTNEVELGYTEWELHGIPADLGIRRYGVENPVYTLFFDPTGGGIAVLMHDGEGDFGIMNTDIRDEEATFVQLHNITGIGGEWDITATRKRLGTRNALGLARLSDIPAPVSLAPATNYTDAALASATNGMITTDNISEYAPTPDLSNYATKSALNAVSNEAQLVYRLFSGSNVVMEVTNYNSQVNAPEMKLLQLNESNEYFTVWTETNGLKRTLNTATAQAAQLVSNETLRAEAAYAPRAWSRTTSGMGAEAPEGVTWLSTPVTVIAGGYEYEKHVTSGGAIWLLTSRGATFDINPATNNTAYLNIAASDGTPIFRIEKTDSYLIGVNANAVDVDGDALVVGMDLISATHPFVRVCTNLVNAVWYEEDENGFPRPDISTITWTQRTGGWTCRISNNTGSSSLFARFEYLQEGGVKVINTGATDLSGGIVVNGVHYSTLGTTTVNGKTVLTLEN